ncbi:MAG: HYC_CC_PP family protein [Xanthomarina gelatinilytica]|uniref:HYC_CC_PP family protein n=1 Tax=Xanthomarina gelatinilytica TaxID=1137281 RepID=UPI003A890117
MKQFFHKIMSLTMVFVVLFSTMSFTMNMHYCGDTLVETALFHKAKGCGMEMGNPSTESCSITKKNCCDDKQLSIEGQDELQLTIDKISFEQQVFIASFVYTYINLFEGLEKNVSSYEEYKPPLVIRRIYKIDETYLI